MRTFVLLIISFAISAMLLVSFPPQGKNAEISPPSPALGVPDTSPPSLAAEPSISPPLPVITAPQTVTAEIPWQAGQITTQGIQQEYVINRKFLGITPQGHYQMQDFYQHSGAKRTDPFITTNADRLLEMLPLYEDENIEGELSL